MTRFLTVGIILALAAPTLADAKSRKPQRTSHPVPSMRQVQEAPQAPTIYGPWGLQTSGKVHLGNPADQVYRMNGDYAGADPDPRIRAMLRRDDPNNDDQ
jgi:hypothetical protein